VVVIDLDDNSEQTPLADNQIRIGLGYPAEWAFKDEDPLVKFVLERAGKLRK
jgi:hypothetical protein